MYVYIPSLPLFLLCLVSSVISLTQLKYNKKKTRCVLIILIR